jgi:hypothetical protein
MTRNSRGPERILRYMSRIRSHVSYANVMATVAVFIALGGTSYAVSQLPRNSVGAKQIRTGAVGKSELGRSAVRSKHIKNRSIAVHDISPAARSSLRGKQGPAGPAGPKGPAAATYGVVVKSNGDYLHARAVSGPNAGHSSGSGNYAVLFNTDVSTCLAAAMVAGVDGVQPENGEIVATVDGSSVFVRTRNSSGAPTDLPFHLIVSC